MKAALGLVLAGIVLGSGAGGGHTSGPPRGPVAAVRAYIAALNRHDPAAICATFAPAMRFYEGHSDTPTTHPVSCRAAVAGHFTPYSDERWRSAAIVQVRSASVDRRGIAAVTLTLDHHYVCVPPHFSPDAPCRTRTIRRPELVYLARVAGSWRVLKPGLVFRATEISAPYDGEQDWYPPGDPRSVTQPVPGVGTGWRCPATSASVHSHDRVDVRSGRGPAPWLSISRLSVSRLPGGRTCFALRLGAGPRPDSRYELFASTVAQAAPFDLFQVDFDGLGRPHALIHGEGRFSNPALSGQLPRIALRGTELDILAPGSPRLTASRYLLAASATSLQLGEPLLADPLQASDAGIPYGACLVVPSGRLIRTGLCGSIPG